MSVNKKTHAETIADIIADMRTKAECAKPYDDGIVMMLTDYADRLEAAYKRERGDCAKLREALTKVKEWMEHRIATCGFEFSATFPTMLEDVVLPALAAPPRNCDRFGGDNAKLQKVYYSECGKEYDPKDPISRQTYLVGYGNWLLAPATKGGNNGNE